MAVWEREGQPWPDADTGSAEQGSEVSATLRFLGRYIRPRLSSVELWL